MPFKSIKSKILFLLLSLSAVVVLTMALLMKFGVNQGFSKYKQGLEKELNDRMVAALEAHYAEQMSWQDFLDEPRSWHELVLKSATEAKPNITQQKQHKRPPRKTKRNNRDSQFSEGKPRPERRQEPRKNRELAEILPAYSLFDEQQLAVIGPVSWGEKKTKKLPLKNAGQVVGYLAYRPDHKSGRRQEQQFNDTIVKMLWMIAGVMILFALLITVPVARYFTRPIGVLNQATQQAAAGDFSVRTEIRRNDELGQLGQNFNLLTQTLESNAAVQKKMMADVSHELRTPVAVLMAQIEALQDGIHQADEKSLGLLHDQIIALRHLINDLHQLSVTDLGSMQYQMQAIDINQVLLSVIDGQSVLAEQQQIKIESQLSENKLLVLGDSNRLQQLFTNLVNNAIKYTDAHGQVVISSYADKETGHVVINIKDSAPGLQPHEMQQMFDRLYRQESSRSKKLGGSGLGLAIAKNITQAHHGQITAKDSDLGGVSLTVRIPKHV